MKPDETLEDMLEALEENYEAAGFSNFREKVLEKMSNEEIIEAYTTLFEEVICSRK